MMIDETYVEFAPDVDAVTAVPLTQNFQNLMVLRGVSKFLPLLVCGSGTVSPEMLNFSKIEKQTDSMVIKQPWRIRRRTFVSRQRVYKKTRNLILSEREYMYTKLRELPFFYVYPAYANFLLVQIQKMD